MTDGTHPHPPPPETCFLGRALLSHGHSGSVGEPRTLGGWLGACSFPSLRPRFFLHVCDAASPSRGSTKNVKKLEERKTDPLSLEGYVGSSLPKAPEKGQGGCLEQSPPTPTPARRDPQGQRSNGKATACAPRGTQQHPSSARAGHSRAHLGAARLRLGIQSHLLGVLWP